MENYNPRQNTRMRWKDAKELEKFIFISGPFAFTNETLEHVLEDKLYGKIATAMIECSKKGIYKGIIIEDTENGGCYIGDILSDNTATIVNPNAASLNVLSLELDSSDKNNIKLKIYVEDDQVVTTDNVKTLFGQTITGTGNINLYRHELIISTGRTSYDETEYRVYLTYYSSNKLEANTPEKLTTLTKANSTTILRGIVLEFTNAGVQNAPVSGKYSGVNYVGQAGWTLEKSIGGSDGTAITSVSDIVTPI
jgi:hypothetical protein